MTRPALLRRLLGVPFTAEQLRAATAPPRPGLIVAGAGSGKTTVMAARVVWLVVTGAVQPGEVLGLTFTTKAAGELADRVQHALRRAGAKRRPLLGAGPEWAGELPTVLTYHAYAARLLAEHGPRVGVDLGSRVLAEAARHQLAERVLRDADADHRGLTRSLGRLVVDLVALDGELAEHLVEPTRLVEFDQQLAAELAGRPGSAELARVAATSRQRADLARLVDATRQARRRLRTIDFADQVRFGAQLAAGCPAVRAAERARYRVVLLDEYQDTSVAGRQLLTALFGDGHPVTAVADPCQSIYGWRGASVANVDRFAEHFPTADGGPADRYQLTVNQRSGGRLLAAAGRIGAPLRQRHQVRPLRAVPARAADGETVVALHVTAVDERRWVVGQLQDQLRRGTPPGQLAVLLRTRAELAGWHDAVRAAGLPVTVTGLGGLLDVPEVADLVATLRLLVDPSDDPALLRLLTGPRWRIGPADLRQLGRRARELAAGRAAPAAYPGDRAGPVDPVWLAAAGQAQPTASLAAAVVHPGPGPWSAAAAHRLALLGFELRRLRRHLAEPLPDLVHRVLRVSGLDVEAAASPAARAAGRADALAAFVELAGGFTDLDATATLPGFVAFLRAAAEHDHGLAPADSGVADAVRLLTVHQAKGLEWDVVAVPGLVGGGFPHRPAGSRWTTNPAVLPYPLRGDAADLPELAGWDPADRAGFARRCAERHEQEERRLAYVAFTRARRLLLASGHWWAPGSRRPRGPSPFLDELHQLVATGQARSAGWAPAPPAGTDNPLRSTTEVCWPVPPDPAGTAALRTAAALVREELARLPAATAGSLPGTPGLADDERRLLDELDRDLSVLLAEATAVAPAEPPVPLPRMLTAGQLALLRRDPTRLAAELAAPMPRPPGRFRQRAGARGWLAPGHRDHPLWPADQITPAGQAAEPARRALRAAGYADRRPVAVAAPFAIPLGGRVLHGRLDAVYRRTDGSWEVVDLTVGDGPADPVRLAVHRLAWSRLRRVPLAAVTVRSLHLPSGRLHTATRLPGPATLARVLGAVGTGDPVGPGRR